MYVHVTIAVTAPWSNMKVANNLVHPDASLDSTTLLTLRIKPFTIVLAFALFDIFTSTKGPRGRCIGVSDFIAGIAASWLLSICWGNGTVAFATVGRV
jgi:hypothetical protein